MNVMICFIRTQLTRCIICLSVKCLDVLFSSVLMRCLIVAMFRLWRGPGHAACHRPLEPSPLQSGLNIRSRSRQVATTTCFSQGGGGERTRRPAQRWVNILKHPSSQWSWYLCDQALAQNPFLIRSKTQLVSRGQGLTLKSCGPQVDSKDMR